MVEMPPGQNRGWTETRPPAGRPGDAVCSFSYFFHVDRICHNNSRIGIARQPRRHDTHEQIWNDFPV